MINAMKKTAHLTKLCHREEPPRLKAGLQKAGKRISLWSRTEATPPRAVALQTEKVLALLLNPS